MRFVFEQGRMLDKDWLVLGLSFVGDMAIKRTQS